MPSSHSTFTIQHSQCRLAPHPTGPVSDTRLINDDRKRNCSLPVLNTFTAPGFAPEQPLC
jgi:hypothetical protein